MLNEVLTYDNWKSDEPDNAFGSDCAVMQRADGEWTDFTCTTFTIFAAGVICQQPPNPNPFTLCPANMLSYTTPWYTECYWISMKEYRALDASLECAAMGSKLAFIEDQTLNDFIHSYQQSLEFDTMWIGTQQILDGSGQFYQSVEFGTTTTAYYDNFISEYSGGESPVCAAMIRAEAGQWSHLSCEDVKHPYICRIKSKYYVCSNHGWIDNHNGHYNTNNYSQSYNNRSRNNRSYNYSYYNTNNYSQSYNNRSRNNRSYNYSYYNTNNYSQSYNNRSRNNRSYNYSYYDFTNNSKSYNNRSDNNTAHYYTNHYTHPYNNRTYNIRSDNDSANYYTNHYSQPHNNRRYNDSVHHHYQTYYQPFHSRVHNNVAANHTNNKCHHITIDYNTEHYQSKYHTGGILFCGVYNTCHDTYRTHTNNVRNNNNSQNVYRGNRLMTRYPGGFWNTVPVGSRSPTFQLSCLSCLLDLLATPSRLRELPLLGRHLRHVTRMGSEMIEITGNDLNNI
eukprot:XP_011676754.1 PREDICTED: bromodomain-containing protein DDB_G0270170-like [Strongylocentrotus purpuratus]